MERTEERKKEGRKEKRKMYLKKFVPLIMGAAKLLQKSVGQQTGDCCYCGLASARPLTDWTSPST